MTLPSSVRTPRLALSLEQGACHDPNAVPPNTGVSRSVSSILTLPPMLMVSGAPRAGNC
jgi:hypothetical protein